MLFDNRSSSWWKWSPINAENFAIDRIFEYDDNLYLLSSGKFYKFDDVTQDYYYSIGHQGYFDELENESIIIPWKIESQKLHLSTNNYYKHISNITLSSVDTGDRELSLNLNIKNYRKYVNDGKFENFDYDIDVIRTFVKRLNYAKVCEFQYTLSNNPSNATPIPLALSNITIKYRIGGQVR